MVGRNLLVFPPLPPLSLGGPSLESHCSFSFCSFKTTEGTQWKSLLSCLRRCAGQYLIYIVSKQTVPASAPPSEQTWDVRGIQGSAGNRERQETCTCYKYHIALCGFPRGLFTEPPGQFLLLETYILCQLPRPKGVWTTNHILGGVQELFCSVPQSLAGKICFPLDTLLRMCLVLIYYSWDETFSPVSLCEKYFVLTSWERDCLWESLNLLKYHTISQRQKSAFHTCLK